MERDTALKKLRKILGDSLGYRVDPKAPSADEREAARLELPAAFKTRKDLEERMEARRQAILDADAEYQALKADHAKAKDRVARLHSVSLHYRITVGTTDGLFFSVKAEGDGWQEIIDKVTAKAK